MFEPLEYCQMANQNGLNLLYTTDRHLGLDIDTSYTVQQNVTTLLKR